MEMNEKIRLRRLRKTDLIRQLAAETNVNVNDLVYPIFIKEGRKIKEEITNMPNIYRYSIDNLDAEIEEIKSLGIKTIILFGIPKFKNESGDGAYIKQGIIQKTVRHLREVTNDLTIITDVCLCQYINHGHCGVIKNDKILNSLFKGDEEFDDPYFATWFLNDDELTQKIPTNFTVTKGSSSGGNNPTVVFKPLR